MSSKALRSLMKERQLAKRIQHEYAKYDTIGKLTCTLCNGLAVKTEALWPSHLTSKQHRLSLQNQKSSLQVNSASSAKRKSEVPTSDQDVSENTEGSTSNSLRETKRTRFDDTLPEEEAEEVDETPTSNLPSGFFDDESQRPPPRSKSPDETDPDPIQEDPEWAAFEASLATKEEPEDQSSVFTKASIFVEPVPYNENGIPENEHQVNNTDLSEQVKEEEEVEEEEDPIEKKIREEKEEIMERIQN
ncbi:uncharacterized protein MELLADRAFT_85439 [Melampsora larici-populina 98AG31]|uniref:Coiled-coil domain-containing protein 16 n=1 Tax=Melampsora larici-populina (strain 98AG31 / pathotype 3-4-7) TaxID=747676 RepID=F4RIP7_MELLP|nr:uncharacterized protein MELLADRAFT_85439 [Melampsora larici-populina 98AG31]EGG07796.1 hypothetical protein MELLADRAFT_85439 [Melampsora larici-populina 98AG31]